MFRVNSGAAMRGLIVLHRWLGVALSIPFLIWFVSGIAMMYWDFPGVTAPDRLAHGSTLSAAAVHLSPAEAWAASGLVDPPTQARLSTFDGRPVYRFRDADGETLVYADTGEPQVDVSAEMRRRIAARWAGQPAGQPANGVREREILEPDQWTVGLNLRALRPVWQYAFPGGDEVYVSGSTGEVVQATTRGSRLGAYVGAIPHWFYITALRSHGSVWSQVVIWTSGIGAIAALLGLVIGLVRLSPTRRYRYDGAPSALPYRGMKRWHTLIGLIAGVGAVTWAFSGMLSMEPFPSLTERSPGGTAAGRLAPRSLTQALRTPVPIDRFAGKDPGTALRQAGDDVRELELTTFGGTPFYLATLAGGATRVVPLDTPPLAAFEQSRVETVVREAIGDARIDAEWLSSYDAYYLDRRGDLPLPVLRVVVASDGGDTRYYVSPATGRVVGRYDAGDWINRWLYHGLHSLDFPWLYAYRPLWDVVMLLAMGGGIALCVTSLVLAWRVLGRTVGRRVGGLLSPPGTTETVRSAGD